MIKYNRNNAIAYAEEWAFSRNPKYYNFDNVGGDCTSFISQCLLAGGATMNYKKDLGWYYKNGNDKSPSWSGVEFLYNFLTTNKNTGPVGKQVSLKDIEVGDIIQLSFDGKKFSHTLLVVKKDINIYVASHTYDVFGKNLNEYIYKTSRAIHIEGIRE